MGPTPFHLRSQRQAAGLTGLIERTLSDRLTLLLASSLLLAGCRQSLVPLPTVTSLAIVEPTATQPLEAPTSPPLATIETSPEYAYAVVWVPADQPLQARQPAGITSMAVDSLAADQRGIAVTGRSTLLGSSTWVEIFLPQGGTGWVNGWNLTEDVSGQSFCDDPRVADLVNRFIMAVQQRDGAQLAQLVSPKRGLIVRHDWWNPEVVLEAGEVKSVFQDPVDRVWGVNRDSEQAISGPFREIILPRLEEVFSVAPETACNGLGVGTTAQPAQWPSEYTNLNFLSFYRPAPAPGNALNWRTWALGVEFVEGQPYLAVVVQYRGEI